MIRESIASALKDAMKARDSDRVAALRLVQAALKNRDIDARTGGAPADDDVLVVEVLQKMTKQRRESIQLFEQGGRPELAARERFELSTIEAFLPKGMDEDEARAAIRALVAEAGATGPKDMGAVMALVKARLAGRIDMGQASALVRAALAG